MYLRFGKTAESKETIKECLGLLISTSRLNVNMFEKNKFIDYNQDTKP